MATDQEISEGLLSLFRDTNPNSFNSLNQVILRLQSNLGFDLSDKIDFIRSQINSIFSQPSPPPPPPPPPPQQVPSPSPVPRPLPPPVHPGNPNLNVSYHPNNPNPNNPNLNVSYHPKSPNPSNPTPSNPNLNVLYHPNSPNPSNPSPNNPNLNVSYHPNSPSNPNLNVSYHPNGPSPNNPNLNVSYGLDTPSSNPGNVNPNLNVSYRPNNIPHHPHAPVQVHPRVFHRQSHFPNGPTEICFGQPAGGTVVTDSISTPPAKDSSQKPKRRGGSGGLNKLCGVTPQLQAIVGQPTMPRTEIVKQLWAYIRKNNLQDPSNKRKIICNEELRLVFEVDCTDMFQMNKLLAKHILPLNSTNDSGQQSKKLKFEESQAPIPEPYHIGQQSKKLKAEESEAPIPEPTHIGQQFKKLKAEESQAPITEPTHIVISEALANFFGTTEMKMLQSDVYKRIEEYIKTEGLEDTSSSMVICDPKLQELLGCESITASAVRDNLARNHTNQQA